VEKAVRENIDQAKTREVPGNASQEESEEEEE